MRRDVAVVARVLRFRKSLTLYLQSIDIVFTRSFNKTFFMKKIKLTKYEQDIEDNFEKLKKSPNQKALKQALMVAAKNYVENKKPITIRVAQSDIVAMKNKAAKMGVPYQTYINILIHKDALKTTNT